MATFHFQIKSGRKGTASDHASYIARKGFHSKRGDLVYASHGNLPDWTGDDPDVLWRAVDRYDRKNAAAYREAIVALPGELTPKQNEALAVEVVEKLTPGKPYQVAIHAPLSSLEGVSNRHLHLMTCDRMDDGIERPAERFFSRHNATRPEQGGRRKSGGGRNRMQLRDELIAVRKEVADTINRHLELHGHAVRVDHRTLKAQGVARTAERHLGQARIRGMSAEGREQFVSLRHKRKSDAE
ncbi:MobA/MobL family protein [Luteimonas sp. MC1825]|uniref:MobA/MobL family protein n=1 Tax=Luteimonas sp. MC1825 TaxID=2761107 RepID=UPI00160B700D|nr:MobA/MobL family protein [Luteimonas sp. MC1825]MBB6600297.1 MobA/MobL family protein [Luteimonas sp. MC1825]QOC87977.1 MobA/MobL family protein [Luteimonas sp. MC1825]